MFLMKRAGLVTGAAALSLTAFAQASDVSSDDDLKARLLAAETRIAELEASNGDHWLTEQRAEEIRGLVQDVLADADLRASLMGSGITSGWDNGAVLGSSDGNWLLRINGLLQARFVFNNQDDDDNTAFTPDPTRYGFDISRAQLIFSGNVVNPSWTYMLQMDFGSDTVSRLGIDDSDFDPDTAEEADLFDSLLEASGYVPLDEVDEFSSEVLGKAMLKNAWIRWDYGNGWGVKFGQFKSPFLREELVYGGYQLAVERSNVNEIFTLGYTQGVMIEYQADNWRAMGTFNDGGNQANTPWNAETTEWAFGGRVEYMFSGNWSQFDEFTSPRGEEQGILLGVAGYYELQEFGTGFPPATTFNTTEIKSWGITVDAQAEFGGFNLFGMFVFRNNDVDALTSNDQWGFVVQGGYMLTDTWELFGRFEWADLDFAGLDDPTVLTIGVNRYFAGQNLKWTTDWLIAFNEMDLVATNTGMRPDDGDGDNQWAIRTQLQLMF